MRLMERLQNKFGRYAIPNLTLLLIVIQGFCLIAGLQNAAVFKDIEFNLGRIYGGEVWRIVTFLAHPPVLSPLFAIIYFMVFHLCGTSIEREWGDFRYNCYVWLGVGASIGAAFFAGQFMPPNEISLTSGFVEGTVFLAFAHLYPDFQFRIFFILPVRVRWLALFAKIGYALAFFDGLLNPADGGLFRSLAVVASIANYLLFFGGDYIGQVKARNRRRHWQTEIAEATPETRHCCTVCGITEVSHPDSSFRYCSECTDTLCYCTDHIREHEHVIREQDSV